jgi:hypothetical protein
MDARSCLDPTPDRKVPATMGAYMVPKRVVLSVGIPGDVALSPMGKQSKVHPAHVDPGLE